METTNPLELKSIRIRYVLYVAGGINVLVLVLFFIRYAPLLRYLLFKTEPYPNDPGKTLAWFVQEGASATVFSLYWLLSLIALAFIIGLLFLFSRKKTHRKAAG